MTEEQLNIPILFLGAIDIRNDAKVVEVALTFARSLYAGKFFQKPIRDNMGKVITADDLAKGEKTEDLPEQKPADSEEQAVQDVHLQPRNKDGLLWPYSERGLPNTATTARFTGPSPESPVGDEGKYRGRYKLVNTDDYSNS